jgi:hypothetical protein
MTDPPKADRLTIGTTAAGVIAVGCCAGIPLAASAIAAIGSFAFGAIAGTVVLVLVIGVTLVRRRRPCATSSPHEPLR